MNTVSNVLVIGGTGILSRAIVTSLINAGSRVVMITDGKGLLPEPAAVQKHLLVDRNNEVEMRKLILALDRRQWDLVVDCICYNPRQAKSLLNILSQIDCGHIISISTYLVYKETERLIAESADTLAADSAGNYERGKIEMEQAYLNADIPATILRLPHVLGVGSQLGIMPMHNRDYWLLRRIIDGKPLFLADNCSQKFQLVFNEDVAKVILKLGANEEAFDRVYNCANPETFTALDYFHCIADLLGSPVNVKTVPTGLLRESEWGWEPLMCQRIMDTSKINHFLDTGFWTDLRKSIKITADNLLIDMPEPDESYACLDDLEKLYDDHDTISNADSAKREEYSRVIRACRKKRKSMPTDSKLCER